MQQNRECNNESPLEKMYNFGKTQIVVKPVTKMISNYTGIVRAFRSHRRSSSSTTCLGRQLSVLPLDDLSAGAGSDRKLSEHHNKTEPSVPLVGPHQRSGGKPRALYLSLSGGVAMRMHVYLLYVNFI